MDNMQIYNAVRAVPEEAKKPFSNGTFSGTDINPMWRIKTLTEQFGVCGFGWYYEILSERAETYGETVMAIVDINLYVKIGDQWSKPIFGTGGNLLVQVGKNGAKPSDEGYKKALTDAISVACKALGIGADVYYQRDQSSKYAQYETKPEDAKKAAEKPEYKADESEPAFPVCEACGRPIKSLAVGDKIMPPEQVAEKTKAKYGVCLCNECASKAKGAKAAAGVES